MPRFLSTTCIFYAAIVSALFALTAIKADNVQLASEFQELYENVDAAKSLRSSNGYYDRPKTKTGKIQTYYKLTQYVTEQWNDLSTDDQKSVQELHSDWKNADAEFLKNGYTIAHMNDVWNERNFAEKLRLGPLYELWKISQKDYASRFQLLPTAAIKLKTLHVAIIDLDEKYTNDEQELFEAKEDDSYDGPMTKTGKIRAYYKVKNEVSKEWESLSTEDKASLQDIYDEWDAAHEEFLKLGYTIAHMNDVWAERSFKEKIRLGPLYSFWIIYQDNYFARFKLLPTATKKLNTLKRAISSL